MISGVYQILNTINNKCYIGQSYCVEGRLKDHFSSLKRNHHICQHLQNSFNKYGEQAFTTRILTRCAPEHLTQVEQGWMTRLKPEYNKAPAAGSTLGIKLGSLNKKRVKAIKERMLGNQYGKGLIGYHPSEEHRKKIGLTKIGNQYMLGFCHSEKTKAKMKTAHINRIYPIGYKHSMQAKAKMSQSQIGNKNSLGHKHTEESKARMREAWKKRKENTSA